MPKVANKKHRIDCVVSEALFKKFKDKVEKLGYESMSEVIRGWIVRFVEEPKNEEK